MELPRKNDELFFFLFYVDFLGGVQYYAYLYIVRGCERQSA